MQTDHFSSDILDFLKQLHFHKVRYLIVGGEAVIYYGNPRLTGDVDFFYDTSGDNIENLFQALLKYWDQDIPGIAEKSELAQKDYVVQFGVPPNRIDLMSEVDGISFDEAWDNRNVEEIDIEGESVSIYYVGLADLIKNKESTGRHKDMEDLDYLKGLGE